MYVKEHRCLADLCESADLGIERKRERAIIKKKPQRHSLTLNLLYFFLCLWLSFAAKYVSVWFFAGFFFSVWLLFFFPRTPFTNVDSVVKWISFLFLSRTQSFFNFWSIKLFFSFLFYFAFWCNLRILCSLNQ